MAPSRSPFPFLLCGSLRLAASWLSMIFWCGLWLPRVSAVWCPLRNARSAVLWTTARRFHTCSSTACVSLVQLSTQHACWYLVEQTSLSAWLVADTTLANLKRQGSATSMTASSQFLLCNADTSVCCTLTSTSITVMVYVKGRGGRGVSKALGQSRASYHT